MVNYTTLGDYSVANATALTNVTLSSNVSSVGNSVFGGCVSLATVDLTSATNITTFGNRVFDGCIYLPRIRFSNSPKFTSLGSYAFNECIRLSSVTFSDSGLITLGDHAFNGCVSLQSLNFTRTGIGNGSGISTNAFVGSSISNIIVPDSVSSSVYSTWTGYKDAINTAAGGFTVTVSATVSATVVCFLKGTRILTRNRGYTLVENLTKSDKLINHNGKKMNILDVSVFTCVQNKNTNPYIIPKGYCIDSMYTCTEDLYLSPGHEILINNVFTAIQNFGNRFQQIELAESYDYYHITTDNYFTDVIMANGIPSESFGMYMCENMNTFFINALFRTIRINRISRKLLSHNRFIQLFDIFKSRSLQQSILS